MNRLFKPALLAIVALTFLAACSTPPPVSDDHYYRLNAVEVTQQFSAPVFADTLRVDLPEAASVRRSRKMIYSNDSGHLRFQQYHYHHWEDSVPGLVQKYLTRSLQTSGIANQVIDQARGNARYQLKSRIARFDRLLAGSGATAHIEIEVWLVDRQDPDRWVMKQLYEEKQAAASMSMEATVVAFSTAMNRISQRLLADLGQLQH